MSLHLSFSTGIISGGGDDFVGDFVISGRYDLKSGKVWLHKRYVGKYDVFYKGYGEVDRGIWGVWEIKDHDRGGFHIWPKGMADPTTAKLKAVADIPIEEVVLVKV